jgi:hypothetical protein
MRISLPLALAAAVFGAIVVVVLGAQALAPARPLLVRAAVEPAIISPNADGLDDVTVIRYELSRSANVTLRFEGEGGTYTFRADEPRTAGDYRVEFSGVVDGFSLPDDQVFGQIMRRLMPDGVYTWSLTATDSTGAQDVLTGTLTLTGGDAPLPDITEFTVSPERFTPNQDGISDRVQINVFLSKDAELRVYLEDAAGTRFFIPQRLDVVRPGERGRHTFDYEAGVDQNANPPPDGTYTLVASAQDRVGQRIERTSTVELVTGGKPYAQILTQPTGVSVVFEPQPWDARFASTRERAGARITPPSDPASLTLTTIAMPVGDLLVFSLTVENNGPVPIRTTGPEPGTVYSWEQNASTLGWFEEPGAWRVGIDCTTAARDYPWRWGLSGRDGLTAEVSPIDGVTYYYLPPGERRVVYGAIRMTQVEVYNPQNCWAGLIHEGVAVTEFNRNVGARQIELVLPEPAAPPAGG